MTYRIGAQTPLGGTNMYTPNIQHSRFTSTDQVLNLLSDDNGPISPWHLPWLLIHRYEELWRLLIKQHPMLEPLVPVPLLVSPPFCCT